MNNIDIRVMDHDDYQMVLALWESCEGVGLSEADSEPNIRLFLDRNPGLSYIVCEGDRVIGAILCGEDGRRGYLHHLAVHPAYRRRGIGGNLVRHCLRALAQKHIHKCHLFIFSDNFKGIDFWESEGWSLRDDLHIMSKFINDECS